MFILPRNHESWSSFKSKIAEAYDYSMLPSVMPHQWPLLLCLRGKKESSSFDCSVGNVAISIVFCSKLHVAYLLCHSDRFGHFFVAIYVHGRANVHSQTFLSWVGRCHGSKCVHGQTLQQPGIDPGSHRWQRCILPLDHWCGCVGFERCKQSLICFKWAMHICSCFAHVCPPSSAGRAQGP